MAKSAQSFGKRERELAKEKKRQEKAARKVENKANKRTLDSDEMFAYVDEFGRITSEPPDPSKRVEINPDDIQISTPKRVEEAPDAPRTGTVSFFNDSKGFGFIDVLGSRDRIFVHVSQLKEEIREGQRVTFGVEKGPKGLTATEVRVDRGG